MFYYYSLGGMNFIWWGLFVILMFWIFIIPYDIPGQRRKKRSTLFYLQLRLASGEIGPDEYHERKKIIEIDETKHT